MSSVNEQNIQYLFQAESSQGASARELIIEALENPEVFEYVGLLDLPFVQQLNKSESYKYLELVHLFSFGTFSDYINNQEKFPPLSPAMLKKLRQITVINLAKQQKVISFVYLLRELELENTLEVQELLRDMLHKNLIYGFIDIERKSLIVDVMSQKKKNDSESDEDSSLYRRFHLLSPENIKALKDEVDDVTEFCSQRVVTPVLKRHEKVHHLDDLVANLHQEAEEFELMAKEVKKKAFWDYNKWWLIPIAVVVFSIVAYLVIRKWL